MKVSRRRVRTRESTLEAEESPWRREVRAAAEGGAGGTRSGQWGAASPDPGSCLTGRGREGGEDPGSFLTSQIPNAVGHS